MSDLFNRVADELVTDQQYRPVPEYEKGVLDCIEGLVHVDRSPDYTRGYGDQYSKEQQRSEGNGSK